MTEIRGRQLVVNAVALALIGLASTAEATGDRDVSNRPNILLVTADTWFRMPRFRSFRLCHHFHYGDAATGHAACTG